MKQDVQCTASPSNVNNVNNTGCLVQADDKEVLEQHQDGRVPNMRPELKMRDGYPDFTQLEETYRYQCRPAPEHTDRVQFLHNNKMSVPEAMFKDNGRLSATGWLWATRTHPPVSVLPNITDDEQAAATADMDEHRNRLRAASTDSAVRNYGRQATRQLVDELLLNALDDARDQILHLQGVPIDDIINQFGDDDDDDSEWEEDQNFYDEYAALDLEMPDAPAPVQYSLQAPEWVQARIDAIIANHQPPPRHAINERAHYRHNHNFINSDDNGARGRQHDDEVDEHDYMLDPGQNPTLENIVTSHVRRVNRGQASSLNFIFEATPDTPSRTVSFRSSSDDTNRATTRSSPPLSEFELQLNDPQAELERHIEDLNEHYYQDIVSKLTITSQLQPTNLLKLTLTSLHFHNLHVTGLSMRTHEINGIIYNNEQEHTSEHECESERGNKKARGHDYENKYNLPSCLKTDCDLIIKNKNVHLIPAIESRELEQNKMIKNEQPITTHSNTECMKNLVIHKPTPIKSQIMKNQQIKIQKPAKQPIKSHSYPYEYNSHCEYHDDSAVKLTSNISNTHYTKTSVHKQFHINNTEHPKTEPQCKNKTKTQQTQINKTTNENKNKNENKQETQNINKINITTIPTPVKLNQHKKCTNLNNNNITTNILYSHEQYTIEADETILLNNTTLEQDNFHGYCIDSGASRTLVGKQQFDAYCKDLQVEVDIQPSPHTFRFGSGVHQSIGSFMARLPLPNSSFLTFKTYIVPIDVPFLIGLDVLF